MKQHITRLLDYLTPPDIKELEHSEEQARAKVLLLVLLASILFLMLALAAGQLSSFSPLLHTAQTQIGMILAICAFALAIGVFQQTGLYVVSGNIYAAASYSMVVLAIVYLPHEESPTFFLHLLAMPMITSLIANYASGIVWLCVVAITPVLLSSANSAGINTLTLANWVANCMGIFVAIYISHYYREVMSRRLNSQCSWLEFTAAHDPLTGLANRATFEAQLEKSIELCKLHNSKAVLVYIDLDKFKPINDNYGHQAGDEVLKTVADRLRLLVRSTDTVARLGGDEFAILFSQCNPAAMAPVVDRISTEVNKPIKAFGHQLNVGCSIGAVVCPDDGLDALQLSHKADERMYEVKRATHKIKSL
jgi:diguanylate cyclase (GGDEF)-like protein